MIRKLLGSDAENKTQTPKEGDLYKVIRLWGKIFEIKYGYYEDCDRHSQYAEPMEIYPDFLKDPQFTDDGAPFVTAIQVPCAHYAGNQDENSTCEDCTFYRHGEELIGLCICPDRNILSKEPK